MKRIAIIGCGFSGTMTAVHLIKKAIHPLELILIDTHDRLFQGIAYNPNSKRQLLNVVASKMSAFQDKPDHFSDWVARQNDFSGMPMQLLANTYLPRYIYGQYLKDIWRETVQSTDSQNIRITVEDALVVEMEVSATEITLCLKNGKKINADYCVIASGNNSPANPNIPNNHFFSSPKYFRNPWNVNALRKHDPKAPVLILGNGLSMADTVLGLIENGFGNKIHTISHHGYTLLQHRYLGISYSAITEEFNDKKSLLELLIVVKKHIRLGRKLGFNAEPVVDAIRPFVQQLWQNLTPHEKRMFLSRLRHSWDTARHRIPAFIHEQLIHHTESGKLHLNAGKLIDISEHEGIIKVLYFDIKEQTEKELFVSAVINCTGPATDFSKSENEFLKNCIETGTIIQDDLKLGIMADPDTFEVYNSLSECQHNLLTLGSHLKGILWESTAVNELRGQAERVASCLLKKIN